MVNVDGPVPHKKVDDALTELLTALRQCHENEDVWGVMRLMADSELLNRYGGDANRQHNMSLHDRYEGDANRQHKMRLHDRYIGIVVGHLQAMGYSDPGQNPNLDLISRALDQFIKHGELPCDVRSELSVTGHAALRSLIKPDGCILT